MWWLFQVIFSWVFPLELCQLNVQSLLVGAEKVLQKVLCNAKSFPVHNEQLSRQKSFPRFSSLFVENFCLSFAFPSPTMPHGMKHTMRYFSSVFLRSYEEMLCDRKTRALFESRTSRGEVRLATRLHIRKSWDNLTFIDVKDRQVMKVSFIH